MSGMTHAEFEAQRLKINAAHHKANEDAVEGAVADAMALANKTSLLRGLLNENSDMLGSSAGPEREAYRRLERAYDALYDAAQDVVDALNLVKSVDHGVGSYLETAIWALKERQID